MGVALAGIAFRRNKEGFSPEDAVSRLFGKRVEVLQEPVDRSFDCRHDHDVLVQQYGDIWVISNDSLTMPLLEDPQHDVRGLYETLDSPELMLCFCQYDSGDCYGYAFIEDGVLTRSRLQASDLPLQQFGPLKAFERKWEAAEFYLDEDDCPQEEWQKIYYLGDREVTVMEHFLTSRMTYEALTEYMGVCPWEASIMPQNLYFRLYDMPVQQAQETVERSDKNKPWWKLW
jgi:hypothetical protein